MIDFFFLIPIAIGLGLIGLASFMWTLKNGQYDDLQGAAERISVRGDRRGGCSRSAVRTQFRAARGNSTGQWVWLSAKVGNFEETIDNILLAFF